ncbi:hypothetical protein CHU92_06510 [Flavobacterium cyanobacteriorum]|uniref:DUF4870 domain-containing protein n=1 Tax=Flavobacterium cyanobacteriorum TaxID=2022802 RepID=A0A255ZB75_9FLAO|nr:DUF4870 domain-containing protein [Flavobacterium cyanobacteriorum]OYQ38115.1 hypothetical protein CHU92_06510 [Flavobacterium cyanobacteriorum]
METTANRNTATLLQLSALTQYFFPLGNYIFPLFIWSFRKNESAFVDYNGKQAINFQLSMLLYMLVLGAVAVPLFLYSLFSTTTFSYGSGKGFITEELKAGNISGLLVIGITATIVFIMLKIFEFCLILYAAVKNSNGQDFNFPLTISFIK